MKDKKRNSSENKEGKELSVIIESDGQMKMSIPKEPNKIRHEWRKMYQKSDLEQAQRFIDNRQYKEFKIGDHYAAAKIGAGANGFKAEILGEADSYSVPWDPEWLCCTCVKGSGKSLTRHRRWYDDDDNKKQPCSHTAALFLLWERQHGPWKYRETEEEKRVRLERQRQERLEREAEKKRQEEEKRLRIEAEREVERRKQQKLKEEGEKCSAVDFLSGQGGFESNRYFDIKKLASTVRTNLYEVHRAEKLMTAEDQEEPVFEIQYGKDGFQELKARAWIRDEVKKDDSEMASLVISRHKLLEHTCQCRGYWSGLFYRTAPEEVELCGHELMLLSRVNDYINANNPGDATDRAAEMFFRAMEETPSMEEAVFKREGKDKTSNLVLMPLLTMDGSNTKIAFRIGVKGEKMVIVKRLRDLADAYERETVYSPSKTVSIDFSQMDFEEESRPWFTFILQRISDMDHINNNQSHGYWYGSQASVQSQEVLEGALLDRFYDMAEGRVCELQNKMGRKNVSEIRVGHRSMQVNITSSGIRDSSGALIGVELTGHMPVILKGSSENYILDEYALSRISKEEAQAMRPFQSVADTSGNILFRVGKEKLAEFYYRVVPELTEQSFVDFKDEVAGEAEALLPPEPEFTFRLDLEQESVYCRTTVSYQGMEYPLNNAAPNSEKRTSVLAESAEAMKDRWTGYRDVAQEERVNRLLIKYFPVQEAGNGLRSNTVSEEDLYQLLQEGITELMRYGTVLGTEAFQKVHIRSTPSFKLGVSIESGILDLELLSKDVSPEELLAILASYRKKKRYHVLKNGDYVTLSDSDSLDALVELSEGMDLDLQKLANGKLQMPAYRALYLDKLLEEHDALTSSRDKTYRSLIKNFQTIRDADYEIPESMTDTLRSYQAYGYKWLRTLQEAGFGGILADEMGLGKTVQTIALFQAWHEEGLKAPVLVVCPASLVYNWQEEIGHFAPELTVSVLAGSMGERKKLISKLASSKMGDFPEINIISYDLLRRDIALLEKVSFHAAVIDEAQYIKNSKAAMTKAVKVVKAQYRYALTGTPIENRLAELWSIFDFLMPGFLYEYSAFSGRFETPIVKGKDKAVSEKLKAMVRPFILRRLKKDVLKDLPEKLEEVRYARFEDEQRKIYGGQVVLMRNLISNSASSGEEKIRILAELTRLREICCDPSLILEDYHGGSTKREACMELVESAMGGGHRMLIFSQFTSMLEILEKDLKERKIPYYKITGSTPKEQRLKLVRQFNEGDTPVFLISLKAGGTGLNLTGADVVIHYDPWWNLAVQNQATDRAHRIGQKNKVTVYRMIVKHTIEEKILALQEAKKDLADEILSGDSKSLFSLSTEELLQLLE